MLLVLNMFVLSRNCWCHLSKSAA